MTLAARYFTSFKGPRRFDLIVGFLVANAMVYFFVTCANAWKLMVIHIESPPTRHSWPLPLLVIFRNTAATIEQFFLTYRYYGLSKSKFWAISIIFLIIIHLASGMAVGVDLLVNPEFGRPIVVLANTVSYCVGAFMDILIPCLLIRELRKLETTYTSTKSAIRRIIVNFASSGCLVAFGEVFTLIVFLTDYEIVLFGCAILAPFYGITVLLNIFVCQRRMASTNRTMLSGDVWIPSHYMDPLPDQDNSATTQSQNEDSNEKHSKSY
jgi:hypothetical protein